MRLPFPVRIPFLYAFYFASGLCAVQLFEGTLPAFALGCFLFVLISVAAFNLAGGFARASGAYVFFFSTLTIIIGIIWKAILGEPAESNLETPLIDIYAFVATACMLFLAVLISQKLVTKRALLRGVDADNNMQTATVGCLIAGILLSVLLSIMPQSNGSVLSALSQLNRFLPMAIMLGVIHAIRRSGGTRSISPPVLIAGFFMFIMGLFGFSKEGMFAPFACWVIAAASQRYRLSRVQILGSILGVFFVFHYLVPYSQYGRAYRKDTFSENLAVSISMLSNLGYVREQYLETASGEQEESIDPLYYNTRQGLFDRLQVLGMDGTLIAHTERFGTFGYYPVYQTFANLVPHFIWKNKPTLLMGNIYAHELGLLSDEDTSTGVSFSPAAEAYHQGGWKAIFFLAPVLWILLFAVIDSLCGDLRRSPWGLLAAFTFAHSAPEGGISGVIYSIVYLTGGIAFAAMMAAYVMPLLGTLLIGPESVILRRKSMLNTGSQTTSSTAS